MPLDLSRAENIGEEREPPKPRSDLIFGQTEVLNVNKVPFDGVSFQGSDGFYQCPACRKNTIKQVLDYRCHKCESKVIAWQCYATKKEEKHQMYDSYISRFYEAAEAKVTMLKAQYKREGKKWPGSYSDSSTNPHPN